MRSRIGCISIYHYEPISLNRFKHLLNNEPLAFAGRKHYLRPCFAGFSRGRICATIVENIDACHGQVFFEVTDYFGNSQFLIVARYENGNLWFDLFLHF